jgi:eukaryotic-like serine/threonine-protein kinase
LEAVLRRLSGAAGFPTLSTTISDVNRVVTSDSHSAQQITQVILRDVSLTTKLLQLVNSAVYGQFRGRIRTVSRAVLILGCEARAAGCGSVGRIGGRRRSTFKLQTSHCRGHTRRD